MTFDQFKNKVQKYSKKIQSAIESDSNTNFIQILSSPEERRGYHGAHFISKRFEGSGDSSRSYVTPYYVTFSHTRFDGKNYLTIRKDFLDKTNKDLRVLFITDSGYSVSTVDFIRKNGYAFKGSKRFEKLWAVGFEKLTFIYHSEPKSEIFWDAKYLAFFKYGDTQYRGSFKVEFFRDKDMKDKIYESEASSGKSLYEKLVHEVNFDMKFTTFQYHESKAVDIGNGVKQKVIKYRNPTGDGRVLYILLTIVGKKPNKNHRISEDEFEEETLFNIPAEIFEEVVEFDPEEAETLLFWKYHIQVKDSYFVRFKFKSNSE